MPSAATSASRDLKVAAHRARRGPIDAICRHLRRRQGPRLPTWESSTTRPRCRPPSRSSSRRGCRAGRGPRGGRSPARSGSTASTTPPARWASRRSSGAPTTTPSLQTPLTYRAAPLDGAEAYLSAPPTTRCSASGGCTTGAATRCGPPRWSRRSRRAARQAQMFIEQDGQRVDVPPRMQVRGSGSDDSAPQVTSIDRVVDEGAVTVVTAGDVEIAVARVVGAPVGNGPHPAGASATATRRRCWPCCAAPEDRAPTPAPRQRLRHSATAAASAGMSSLWALMRTADTSRATAKKAAPQ